MNIPSEVSFTVDVPPEPKMHVAIAVATLDNEHWSPVRFRILADLTGGNEVVFSETVERGDRNRWLARDINDELPLRGRLLMVSGRTSFEIVQKALMARIPFIAAVSAASSLAVELAESSGMGLVGFLRGDSLNVYAGTNRIIP